MGRGTQRPVSPARPRGRKFLAWYTNTRTTGCVSFTGTKHRDGPVIPSLTNRRRSQTTISFINNLGPNLCSVTALKILGPPTEDLLNSLTARSLASFHNSANRSVTQTLPMPYISMIIERVLNAEMYRCNPGSQIPTFLCALFVSATQRGITDIRLTCTMDSSRTPGQAPAIPARTLVSSSRRW